MITIVQSSDGENRIKLVAFDNVNGFLVTRFKFTCNTDDASKALKLVSGSENAVHPLDWPVLNCLGYLSRL